MKVVKGGYRSCSTENTTALSQVMNNMTLAFHASQKIKKKPYGKSWFTVTMTNHKKKKHIFTFHRK